MTKFMTRIYLVKALFLYMCITSNVALASISMIVGGSYSKHMKEILAVTHFLQDNGITVLSTKEGVTEKTPHGKFVFLASDRIKVARLAQDSFFAQIRQSASHIVVNVNGYLGLSSVMEIGFSIANGITIYSVCPVRDATISLYTRDIRELFPDFFEHFKQNNKINCEAKKY